MPTAAVAESLADDNLARAPEPTVQGCSEVVLLETVGAGAEPGEQVAVSLELDIQDGR